MMHSVHGPLGALAVDTGRSTWRRQRTCWDGRLGSSGEGESTVPLEWEIDHGARIVVVTGSDDLRFEDIRGFFYGLTPATLSYGKLLNLSCCSLDITPQELVTLAEQFNALRVTGRPGPAAVVVASEAMYRQVADFKGMTALTRPLEIFHERDTAYTWLIANSSEPSAPFVERGAWFRVHA